MSLARIIARARRFAYREEYDHFSVWKKLSFPNRPTEREVAIYQKFIAQDRRQDANLLILGATPELRDLTAFLGIKPVLVDISPRMLWGMLRLTKQLDATKEVWVKSDWLQAPLPENFFDIIIGDLSLRYSILLPNTV